MSDDKIVDVLMQDHPMKVEKCYCEDCQQRTQRWRNLWDNFKSIVQITLVLSIFVGAICAPVYFSEKHPCAYCGKSGKQMDFCDDERVCKYPCRSCLLGHFCCKSHGVVNRGEKEPFLIHCPEPRP